MGKLGLESVDCSSTIGGPSPVEQCTSHVMLFLSCSACALPPACFLIGSSACRLSYLPGIVITSTRPGIAVNLSKRASGKTCHTERGTHPLRKNVQCSS